MYNVAKGPRADVGLGGLTGLPISPEVAVLAAEVLVHGVERAHASVLLEPDPI